MLNRRLQTRGVLLGMAVGDAMGHPIDNRSLDEIRKDYGPGGLMGYDLSNDYADITSYTQLAAFAANGLLLGLTRGQAQGRPTKLIRFLTAAIREWSRSQGFNLPTKNICWLSGVPAMRRKFCMDNRMLDALSKETLGTLEDPRFRSNHPGCLPTAVPLALMQDDLQLEQDEIDRLAAETAVLTHGEPEAYITAAALCHILCMLLKNPRATAEELVNQTANTVGAQFAQGGKLWENLQFALTQSSLTHIPAKTAMENLGCRTASEVLAGAVYVYATCNRDFDTAMITAVNHSGRSSAVGAVVGAMLGAVLGEDGVPEFYMEGLEAAPYLKELADDMSIGFSEMVGKSLFDMDWDRKYLSVGT
ncbi:MAG: ADP-ribosylglycohydrolase family protein [Ruminococcaceae bacterium]|nr:ADP-ribosylglycohydrolase family protein [Oscillospiraceae bacterium]